MLLIASRDERSRLLMGLAAFDGGSSVLLAANPEEARAHLEQDTVLLRYRTREVEERCSITAAIVELGFDDGWTACRKIHARNEQVPVLWVVPAADYARALALEEGRFDRSHLPEPVDLLMVLAWLHRVRPARIRCEARRYAKEYALPGRTTAVLTRYAQHLRDVPITELAREMEMAERTVRGHRDRMQEASKLTIERLASRVRHHIGTG